MLIKLPSDMKRIRKTFSKEWKGHKYKETKTWRLKVEERKELFLSQMQVSKNELKRKTLLDGGCGNGEMTSSLADYSFEQVIGMDFSDSIFEAYENNKNKDKVFFVQGDIMNPPFEKETFDYIYSDGVIHHTKDTKYSFHQLARLTKKKGKLWVWVYYPRHYINQNQKKLLFIDVAQKIIAESPIFIQTMIIYSIGVPLATFLQWTGIRKEKDSLREKVILMRDGFTHIYEHRQTPPQVRSWFEEYGFNNTVLSDTRQWAGFGMYGVKGI